MEICRDEAGGSRYLKINKSNKSLEVPGCLLYSRGGMIPHLTDLNLNLVNNDADKVWHLPLSTIYEQPGPKVMEKFQGKFHDFSSTQDKIWVLNTSDSHNQKPDVYKYNEEKCISIWAPSGRRKITPDEYMRIVEVFSFDIAISPSDSIPSGETKKRCRKSQERTQKFLEGCLEIKEEKGLKVPLLGVVEGGDSTVFREKSAEDLASRNVDAYVLGGFDRISTDWNELLQLSMKHLKDDKAKMMFGVLTPLQVVDAIELGVDVFDSVIAYDSTQRGCALNFTFKKNGDSDSSSSGDRMAKKVKTDESLGRDLSQYEMNLHEKRYLDDDQPLVAGCKCYCCAHHVRAYLHHLLVTKEMLASVLLMMHNLSYWLEFFKSIRESIKANKFDEFQENLRSLNT